MRVDKAHTQAMKSEAQRWLLSSGSPGLCNLEEEPSEEAKRHLLIGNVLPHTAWGHYGVVWYEDGKFYEAVYVLGQVVATFANETLLGLFREVNDAYGWE